MKQYDALHYENHAPCHRGMLAVTIYARRPARCPIGLPDNAMARPSLRLSLIDDRKLSAPSNKVIRGVHLPIIVEASFKLLY